MDAPTLEHIFSYCDAETLATVDLCCSDFRSLTKRCWKSKISTTDYFCSVTQAISAKRQYAKTCREKFLEFLPQIKLRPHKSVKQWFLGNAWPTKFWEFEKFHFIKHCITTLRKKGAPTRRGRRLWKRLGRQRRHLYVAYELWLTVAKEPEPLEFGRKVTMEIPKRSDMFNNVKLNISLPSIEPQTEPWRWVDHLGFRMLSRINLNVPGESIPGNGINLYAPNESELFEELWDSFKDFKPFTYEARS